VKGEGGALLGFGLRFGPGRLAGLWEKGKTGQGGWAGWGFSLFFFLSFFSILFSKAFSKKNFESN